MFKYLFIFISSVVVENRAFLTTNTAAGLTAKNPVLMRLLQTVDAATTDERLLDVSLQLLKSLCICMRETLKAKQLDSVSFSGDTNSLQLDENNKDPSKKVLDIYQNIYNKTCFDLKNEVASKVNKSAYISSDEEKELILKSECAKTKTKPNTNIVKEEVGNNFNETRLEDILYQTFIKTRSYHKFRVRKYSLYKHTEKDTRLPGKHNIIVILTFYPVNGRRHLIANCTKLTDELNSTLHTHTPIDIDIIDARYGQKENVSEESLTPKEAPDCALKSIYTFLLQSEQNNRTKVFKLIHRNNTIKVYIDVTSEPNHSDYTKMCCSNKTNDPVCKIDFPNESFDSKEITTSPYTIEKSGSFKETILKIKSLVKLYDNRLMKKKLKRSTTLQTFIKQNAVKSVSNTEGDYEKYTQKIETMNEYSMPNSLKHMPDSKPLPNYQESKEIWMNRILDDESSNKTSGKSVTVKEITLPVQEVTVPPIFLTKKYDRVINNKITSINNNSWTNHLMYTSEREKPTTVTKFFELQEVKNNTLEYINSQNSNLQITQTPDIIHPQIDRTTRRTLKYWDETNLLSTSPTTEKQPDLESENIISPLPTGYRNVSTVSLPIEDTLEIVLTANNKQKKISLYDLFSKPNLNVITQNLATAGELTTKNNDNLSKTSIATNSMPTLFSICISLSKKMHSTEHTDHQFTPTKIANISTSTKCKHNYFTAKDTNHFSDTTNSEMLSKENNTVASLNLLETGPQINKAIKLVINETKTEDNIKVENKNAPFKNTEDLITLTPQRYLLPTNLHTIVSNDTDKVRTLTKTQSYGTTLNIKHNDTFHGYHAKNHYGAGLNTFDIVLHNDDTPLISVDSTTTDMTGNTPKCNNQIKIDRNITVTNPLSLQAYVEKINELDHYTETTLNPEIKNIIVIKQQILNSKTNNVKKNKNQNKTDPNYTANKPSYKTLPDFARDLDKLEKNNKTNNFISIENVPTDDYNSQMIVNISYETTTDVNSINKNSLFVTVLSDNKFIQTKQTEIITVTQAPTTQEFVEELSNLNSNQNRNLDTITYPAQNITLPQLFKTTQEIKDHILIDVPYKSKNTTTTITTDSYTGHFKKVAKEQNDAIELIIEKSSEPLTSNIKYSYVTDRYIENTIDSDYDTEYAYYSNILSTTNKYNASNIEFAYTKNKYVNYVNITPTVNYTFKPAIFNESKGINNVNFSNKTPTVFAPRVPGNSNNNTFLKDFTDNIGNKAETYIDSTVAGLISEEKKTVTSNYNSNVLPILPRTKESQSTNLYLQNDNNTGNYKVLNYSITDTNLQIYSLDDSMKNITVDKILNSVADSNIHKQEIKLNDTLLSSTGITKKNITSPLPKITLLDTINSSLETKDMMNTKQVSSTINLLIPKPMNILHTQSLAVTSPDHQSTIIGPSEVQHYNTLNTIKFDGVNEFDAITSHNNDTKEILHSTYPYLNNENETVTIDQLYDNFYPNLTSNNNEKTGNSDKQSIYHSTGVALMTTVKKYVNSKLIHPNQSNQNQSLSIQNGNESGSSVDTTLGIHFNTDRIPMTTKPTINYYEPKATTAQYNADISSRASKITTVSFNDFNITLHPLAAEFENNYNLSYTTDKYLIKDTEDKIIQSKDVDSSTTEINKYTTPTYIATQKIYNSISEAKEHSSPSSINPLDTTYPHIELESLNRDTEIKSPTAKIYINTVNEIQNSAFNDNLKTDFIQDIFYPHNTTAKEYTASEIGGEIVQPKNSDSSTYEYNKDTIPLSIATQNFKNSITDTIKYSGASDINTLNTRVPVNLESSNEDTKFVIANTPINFSSEIGSVSVTSVHADNLKPNLGKDILYNKKSDTTDHHPKTETGDQIIQSKDVDADHKIPISLVTHKNDDLLTEAIKQTDVSDIQILNTTYPHIELEQCNKNNNKLLPNDKIDSNIAYESQIKVSPHNGWGYLESTFSTNIFYNTKSYTTNQYAVNEIENEMIQSNDSSTFKINKGTIPISTGTRKITKPITDALKPTSASNVNPFPTTYPYIKLKIVTDDTKTGNDKKRIILPEILPVSIISAFNGTMNQYTISELGDEIIQSENHESSTLKIHNTKQINKESQKNVEPITEAVQKTGSLGTTSLKTTHPHIKLEISTEDTNILPSSEEIDKNIRNTNHISISQKTVPLVTPTSALGANFTKHIFYYKKPFTTDEYPQSENKHQIIQSKNIVFSTFEMNKDTTPAFIATQTDDSILDALKNNGNLNKDDIFYDTKSFTTDQNPKSEIDNKIKQGKDMKSSTLVLNTSLPISYASQKTIASITDALETTSASDINSLNTTYFESSTEGTNTLPSSENFVEYIENARLISVSAKTAPVTATTNIDPKFTTDVFYGTKPVTTDQYSRSKLKDFIFQPENVVKGTFGVNKYKAPVFIATQIIDDSITETIKNVVLDTDTADLDTDFTNNIFNDKSPYTTDKYPRNEINDINIHSKEVNSSTFNTSTISKASQENVNPLAKAIKNMNASNTTLPHIKHKGLTEDINILTANHDISENIENSSLISDSPTKTPVTVIYGLEANFTTDVFNYTYAFTTDEYPQSENKSKIIQSNNIVSSAFEINKDTTPVFIATQTINDSILEGNNSKPAMNQYPIIEIEHKINQSNEVDFSTFEVNKDTVPISLTTQNFYDSTTKEMNYKGFSDNNAFNKTYPHSQGESFTKDTSILLPRDKIVKITEYQSQTSIQPESNRWNDKLNTDFSADAFYIMEPTKNQYATNETVDEIVQSKLFDTSTFKTNKDTKPPIIVNQTPFHYRTEVLKHTDALDTDDDIDIDFNKDIKSIPKPAMNQYPITEIQHIINQSNEVDFSTFEVNKDMVPTNLTTQNFYDLTTNEMNYKGFSKNNAFNKTYPHSQGGSLANDTTVLLPGDKIVEGTENQSQPNILPESNALNDKMNTDFSTAIFYFKKSTTNQYAANETGDETIQSNDLDTSTFVFNKDTKSPIILNQTPYDYRTGVIKYTGALDTDIADDIDFNGDVFHNPKPIPNHYPINEIGDRIIKPKEVDFSTFKVNKGTVPINAASHTINGYVTDAIKYSGAYDINFLNTTYPRIDFETLTEKSNVQVSSDKNDSNNDNGSQIIIWPVPSPVTSAYTTNNPITEIGDEFVKSKDVDSSTIKIDITSKATQKTDDFTTGAVKYTSAPDIESFSTTHINLKNITENTNIPLPGGKIVHSSKYTSEISNSPKTELILTTGFNDNLGTDLDENIFYNKKPTDKYHKTKITDDIMKSKDIDSIIKMYNSITEEIKQTGVSHINSFYTMYPLTQQESITENTNTLLLQDEILQKPGNEMPEITFAFNDNLKTGFSVLHTLPQSELDSKTEDTHILFSDDKNVKLTRNKSHITFPSEIAPITIIPPFADKLDKDFSKYILYTTKPYLAYTLADNTKSQHNDSNINGYDKKLTISKNSYGSIIDDNTFASAQVFDEVSSVMVSINNNSHFTKPYPATQNGMVTVVPFASTSSTLPNTDNDSANFSKENNELLTQEITKKPKFSSSSDLGKKSNLNSITEHQLYTAKPYSYKDNTEGIETLVYRLNTQEFKSKVVTESSNLGDTKSTNIEKENRISSSPEYSVSNMINKIKKILKKGRTFKFSSAFDITFPNPDLKKHTHNTTGLISKVNKNMTLNKATVQTTSDFKFDTSYPAKLLIQTIPKNKTNNMNDKISVDKINNHSSSLMPNMDSKIFYIWNNSGNTIINTTQPLFINSLGITSHISTRDDSSFHETSTAKLSTKSLIATESKPKYEINTLFPSVTDANSITYELSPDKKRRTSGLNTKPLKSIFNVYNSKLQSYNLHQNISNGSKHHLSENKTPVTHSHHIPEINTKTSVRTFNVLNTNLAKIMNISTTSPDIPSDFMIMEPIKHEKVKNSADDTNVQVTSRPRDVLVIPNIFNKTIDITEHNTKANNVSTVNSHMINSLTVQDSERNLNEKISSTAFIKQTTDSPMTPLLTELTTGIAFYSLTDYPKYVEKDTQLLNNLSTIDTRKSLLKDSLSTNYQGTHSLKPREYYTDGMKIPFNINNNRSTNHVNQNDEDIIAKISTNLRQPFTDDFADTQGSLDTKPYTIDYSHNDTDNNDTSVTNNKLRVTYVKVNDPTILNDSYKHSLLRDLPEPFSQNTTPYSPSINEDKTDYFKLKNKTRNKIITVGKFNASQTRFTNEFSTNAEITNKPVSEKQNNNEYAINFKVNDLKLDVQTYLEWGNSKENKSNTLDSVHLNPITTENTTEIEYVIEKEIKSHKVIKTNPLNNKDQIHNTSTEHYKEQTNLSPYILNDNWSQELWNLTAVPTTDNLLNKTTFEFDNKINNTSKNITLNINTHIYNELLDKEDNHPIEREFIDKLSISSTSTDSSFQSALYTNIPRQKAKSYTPLKITEEDTKLYSTSQITLPNVDVFLASGTSAVTISTSVSKSPYYQSQMNDNVTSPDTKVTTTYKSPFEDSFNVNKSETHHQNNFQSTNVTPSEKMYAKSYVQHKDKYNVDQIIATKYESTTSYQKNTNTANMLPLNVYGKTTNNPNDTTKKIESTRLTTSPGKFDLGNKTLNNAMHVMKKNKKLSQYFSNTKIAKNKNMKKFGFDHLFTKTIFITSGILINSTNERVFKNIIKSKFILHTNLSKHKNLVKAPISFINNARFNVDNGTEKPLVPVSMYDNQTRPVDDTYIKQNNYDRTSLSTYFDLQARSGNKNNNQIVEKNKINHKTTKSIIYNTYKALTEEELTMPPDVRKIKTTYSTIYTKQMNSVKSLLKASKPPTKTTNFNLKSELPSGLLADKYNETNDFEDSLINDTLYNFTNNTYLHPIEKLPKQNQWRSLNRIHIRNRKHPIIMMNTDDFLSFRQPITTKGNLFAMVNPNPLLVPRHQINVPPVKTPAPKRVILRPKFNSFEDFKINPVRRVMPKENIKSDDRDYYKSNFQFHHKPGQSWREKVGEVRTKLEPQRRSNVATARKINFEPVIDVPYYMPTLMKPYFLRDKVESVRSFIYNEGMNKVNGRRHFKSPPRVEKSGAIVDASDTQEHVYYSAEKSPEHTQSPSSQVTRPKKTIFFLSPTIPYNRYF